MLKHVFIFLVAASAVFIVFAGCAEDNPAVSDAVSQAPAADPPPLALQILPWNGSVRLAAPALYRFRMPNDGPEFEFDNPTSRDGNSFLDVATGLDSTTGCGRNCEACHFNFVMELDIEAAPGGPFENDPDGFFDAWHGDNVNDKIIWEFEGGTNSDWRNGNDPNNFGHTSIARFQVDEMVPCGDEVTITFTVSSTTGDVTPVTLTLTLTCDDC